MFLLPLNLCHSFPFLLYEVEPYEIDDIQPVRAYKQGNFTWFDLMQPCNQPCVSALTSVGAEIPFPSFPSHGGFSSHIWKQYS